MAMPELSVAQQAARAGGAIIARYFREGVAMRSKDVSNLVSDADLEAEHAIVDVIRQSFPGHTVLAEEAHQGDAGAGDLWVVDPLDGTNNFAHRIPHVAVSIAYYREGEPQCGVIFNPIREEWYHAMCGQGAYHQGERAQVALHTRLNEVLVGVGFYYDRGVMMEATLEALGEFKRRQVHGVRRFGTASLDLCMVGVGQLGAFFEYTLSPWDFAAGRLFVTEAGGRVTTCQGDPLPLARTGVLATNGLIHEEALEVVSRHDPYGPAGRAG